MGVATLTLYEWVCDLCGHTQITEDAADLEGWTTGPADDPDIVVCPRCVALAPNEGDAGPHDSGTR